MRDLREFHCHSEDVLDMRPQGAADHAAWHDYLHLRENPAGVIGDLWHHQAGCGAWLRIVRNNISHEIISVSLAKDGGKNEA
jgi:sarcosine oxidase subunit delta